MRNLTEQQIRQIIQQELKKSQYKVGGVPYHIHNGIDAHFIYKVKTGNGTPTVKSSIGTLYVNLSPASSTDRLYIYTGTTWAHFTASA